MVEEIFLAELLLPGRFLMYLCKRRNGIHFFSSSLNIFLSVCRTKYQQTKTKASFIVKNALLIMLYLSIVERILCQLFSSVLEVLKDCYFKPICLSKEPF